MSSIMLKAHDCPEAPGKPIGTAEIRPLMDGTELVGWKAVKILPGPVFEWPHEARGPPGADAAHPSDQPRVDAIRAVAEEEAAARRAAARLEAEKADLDALKEQLRKEIRAEEALAAEGEKPAARRKPGRPKGSKDTKPRKRPTPPQAKPPENGVGEPATLKSLSPDPIGESGIASA